MLIPTVKIAQEDGFLIINESDFDPEKHRLFGVDTEPEDDDPRSDDELRAALETAAGKAPHPSMKRETMLAKLAELVTE